METGTDPRIDVVTRLFAAWSSGDVDAPESFFHADAVLTDIVGGEHHGWANIRAFFDRGLKRWPDLVLTPEKFWLSDDSIALSWLMTATVPDASLFGPEAVGKRWASPGMSYIVFDGDLIRHEVDYHDSGSVPRSLGITPSR
jgi:hypothetical protein